MLEAEINAEQGACIGSIEKSSGLYLSKTSLNLSGSGDYLAAIGTINGTDSDLFLKNSRINIALRSDDSTCIGALRGRTDLGIDHSSATLENAGNKALIFGGYKQITSIEMDKADIRIDVHNDLNRDTYAEDEDFTIKGGRVRCMINGKEFKRKVDFE